MTTANVNVTKVLLKRGNTVQNNNYTGVSGELTIDTQLKTLRVHDGVTAGGNAITASGAIGSYSNTNTAAYLASQSITSANIGAFQTFANSNAATQTTSINTVNANIGAYQTFANSNAATQTTSINTVNANIGAYQTFANSNAATQTTEINSLRANITAANTAITNLTSNAAIQATLLDTLTGNAATQSQVLDTLTSNAAAQATSLTTLLGNAVAQQTSLIDLVANAATQAQAIANVTGTYSNANVASYLSSFNGNILPSANVTYSLGSSTRQWQDLWVSNNTIYIGNVPLTVSNGNLLVNGSLVTGSGSGTDDVLRANVGAYQTFANANAATQATSINTFNANLGAYQTFANANLATQTTNINTVNANIGAYYAFANANAATQATSINTFNANLGAYQTYANANVVAIQANLGAYQTFANANAATQATSINTFNANLGAFQTYANTTYGTSSYSNVTANALLSSNTVSTISTTGNITTIANLVATSNVYGSTFIGNVVASGNNIAGNLITVGNLYGNVVGTTGVYSGNVNINGVTTLAGNLGVNGSQVTIFDSILGLHTYANLTPWAADDGRDIGIRMHYYNAADKHAFLGLENTSKTLQFIIDATETASNTTGTFGNVQFGSLLLSNATAATSTTTGALIVSGGIGAVGNIWQSGQHIISNATTSTSTTTGALVVTGGGGFGGNVFANNIIANVTPAVTSTPATGVGYIGMPQNATGSATLTIADAGKHIYVTSTGQTITIPAASSVPYPIGTTIAFIAGPSATTVSIAITTDTMYLGGTGTTGTRTLAAYGMATAVKVSGTSSSGVWFINGTGLT